MRILVSAGGTGGGVYPALAVVAELDEHANVLWIGGEGGMETELVGRANIPYKAIPAAGIHGVGLARLPGNALQLARGWQAAREMIARFQPDVLFFTGGYVGVPVAYAGRGVRSACYVPDIEPALAVKLISRRSDFVAVTTEESRKYFPEDKRVVVSGYPTRFGTNLPDPEMARQRFGLHNELPVLLVYGGSRGARSINNAIWGVLPEILTLAQVIHITGQLDWPNMAIHQSALTADLARNYHPYAYLHDDMAFALSAADLVVARAGAATLGELPLFGLPAILVPYPHAWKYQKTNASYLEDAGAAIVVDDERLSGSLLPTISSLFKDRELLQRMQVASKSLARPDAAKHIANEITALVDHSVVNRD